MKTVVGLYEEISDAQLAINELVRAGFDRADISLVATNRWADESTVATGDGDANDVMLNNTQLGSDVAAGMATGGVVGGLGGVLLGLGALAIPGVGPIIAAGPLVAGLAGAGIGAAVGGLVGALVNWGVPAEEAELYAESVRRGGILVGLKTEEERVERAINIMNQYGPIDVERHSEAWRQSGWSGSGTGQTATGAAAVVSPPSPTGTTQMGAGNYLDYSHYTSAFRDHFQTNYGGSGHEYALYDPAYRYGYTLAQDDRYRNYDTWDEFEATARSGWAQTEHAAGHAWEDFKDAVRHGWESVKDALDFEEDFALFEPGFREHYGVQYTGTGRDYDWYAPAYRYGYDMGMDERWDEFDSWDEFEADARSAWEQTEGAAGRAWDDFKDAIRRGWEDVRDAMDMEADYAEFEPTFREHYQLKYHGQNGTGREYDWYEPAYRYGYISGLDERYDDFDSWDDRLEADIRREWENGEFAAQSAWDDVKDAVRRGWESVREAFDTDYDEDETLGESGGVGGYTSHR